MDSIALTRIACLRGVVGFLGRIGAPVERLLGRAGLRLELLDDEEGLIPLQLAMRFLDLAAREEGIEHLGFRAGTGTQIEALGTFGRAIRCAGSLLEALEVASTLGPIFNSGERLWLEVDGDDVHLRHRYRVPTGEGFAQAEGYTLTIALNVVRLAAGRAWVPAELRLQSSLARPPRTLLAGVQFVSGQTAAGFSFPRALLHRALPPPHGIDAETERSLRRWSLSAPAADFPGSVHQVIEGMSSDLRPRIAMIADAIGISVRSLQRRLATSGMTYDRLLTGGTLAGAAELLRGPDKIIDVAIALGYSDPAHFSRAFRRWTGLSPRDFRRRALSASRPQAHLGDAAQPGAIERREQLAGGAGG